MFRDFVVLYVLPAVFAGLLGPGLAVSVAVVNIATWSMLPTATPSDHFEAMDLIGTNSFVADLFDPNNITTLPGEFRIHNPNKESGDARTKAEIIGKLEKIDQHSQFNKLKHDLFADGPQQLKNNPYLIDLNDYTVEGQMFDGKKATWDKSTNVVYSWQFSTSWNEFNKLYQNILHDSNYANSLKYKLKHLLDANRNARDSSTIFHFKYIGETTRTAALRALEHDCANGSGGSAVLSGMLQAWRKMGWENNGISKILLFVAHDSNPADARDLIKFAECTFATLCGRGIMNGTYTCVFIVCFFNPIFI